LVVVGLMGEAAPGLDRKGTTAITAGEDVWRRLFCRTITLEQPKVEHGKFDDAT